MHDRRARGLAGVTKIATIAAIAAISAIPSACDHAGSASASGSAAPPPPPPPEERWSEVVSDVAPLLVSVSEKFPPPEIVRRGELLRVGKSAGIATWSGALEDADLTRDGMVFSVQRTVDGSGSFAFQTDLGGEVSISASRWICDELAKQGPFELGSCKTNLRRARTPDGAIVSYVPCGTGPCPVALERGKKLGAIAIDGLSSAHFVSGKKKSVLVVETRFTKDDGKRSGGAVSIVALDGAAPASVSDFPSDEVDARDADHLVSKVVKITVTGTEVRATGKLEEHDRDGKVTRTEPVDKAYALPPLD